MTKDTEEKEKHPSDKKMKIPDHKSHDYGSPKKQVDIKDKNKPGINKKPTETK